MKKLIILTIFIISLQLFLVQAYDIQVQSSSQNTVVLAVTGLNTVNVQLEDMQATVETDTISDTFLVDATLKRSGDTVLININTQPLHQDYSSDQIKSILFEGTLNIEGAKQHFAKRVIGRANKFSTAQLAPSLSQSTIQPQTLIYITVGLALLLVLFVLFFILKKPKRKVKKVKKKARRKTKRV
ncbi:hypothetical protein HZA98_01885 [Candidatus Woesearchaeota archaeon]|nr:hypothetical protein [Candidatus Woesearchaeota archaeon]